MSYDAIIVGAGPAGACAAYWLGEAGKRVLVLEKERLPRYKACGGGVPRAVFQRFPFDLSPVVERQVRWIRFRFRDGREVLADVPSEPAAMVMRDRFDYCILQHARADVREGCYVARLQQDEDGVAVETRSGETFRGAYLIGADGANSRVARLVGLRRDKRMGISIEAEVPVDDDTLEAFANTPLFLFGTPPYGYMWIFPKADHLSIGIGSFLGDGTALQDTLEREMTRLGIAVDGAPWRAHPLPIYMRHEPLRQGRVLLAGDAAGLMDPVLGEGIRHAVDSGRLAAETVLAQDVSKYTRRVHREMGDDFLWGLCWAWPFYNHPRGSYDLAVRNPRFQQAFIDLLAGQTTYRRMAFRAPLNLLLGWRERLPVHQDEAETAMTGGAHVGA